MPEKCPKVRPGGNLTRFTPFLASALAILVFAFATYAQQNRIEKPVDDAQRVMLLGHIHPEARAEFDQGRVSADQAISYVTVNLSQSDAQKAALTLLLTQQQTVGSSNYHQWLTPEEYAQRFGATEADIAKMTGWLQSQGLKIVSVAKGRNMIAVDGTAGQFEAAFQTEIHRYLVNGEMHFANATNPTIPAAMQGVVMSIRGLHDFRMKPRSRAHIQPQNNQGAGQHAVVPGDFATIYDLNPLYKAGACGANPCDGTGQTLVIAGQTNINLSDITTFRTNYGLSATNLPTVMAVPGITPPGVLGCSPTSQTGCDLQEADLDVEWSGAIAPNATLLFVYTQDVFNAVEYAIDQNLAPVISVSYGGCEIETPNSDIAAFRGWAQQANTQGITWFNASGDSGAADCGDSTNPGLAVDAPGSIPEITSVGGSEFNEGTGTFWAAANATNGSSALSYIPEIVWNDSVEVGSPDATGGGASMYFTQPPWQVGVVGMPADNLRHVPDISMSASNENDPFIVITGGTLELFGGTSVPTPCFGGIAAILNQYLVAKGSTAGLGNINPNLYSLFKTNPAIFHAINTGNNVVAVSCSTRRNPECDQPVGYNAFPGPGKGYSPTVGLGSVDVNLLITGWDGSKAATPTPALNITLLSNVTTLAAADTAFLTATVNNPSGATPTGTVTFTNNGAQLGSVILSGESGTGSARATLAVLGSKLAANNSITATFGTLSAAAITVNVTAAGSSAGVTPAITSVTNAASYQAAFSPGGLVAIFGTQLAPGIVDGPFPPLPIAISGVSVTVNGIAAPLFYISTTQINIQIPYEVPTGNVTLTVNNNGKLVTSPAFPVNSTAPGIFTDANDFLFPTNTAALGTSITFFFTGGGTVTPNVFDGSTPLTILTADDPVPTIMPTVTIGGVAAPVNSVGIPFGGVGVFEISVVVPNNVSIVGTQKVVLTNGGVNNAIAMLTVIN